MFRISHHQTGALLYVVDAPTLTGAELGGVRLAGADLAFSVLNGADLRLADLQGASLLEADLMDTDLRGCDLRGAQLRGATMRGANLRNANLSHADLRDADLSRTSLLGACFSEATYGGIVLFDAIFDDSTRWPFGLDPQRYGAKPLPERCVAAENPQQSWDNEGGSQRPVLVTGVEEPSEEDNE